ncbi:helix-turn-helix domain-containing protein [Clostridium beijerinckii]|uniref:Helix-turn-helix domain-containing protein n=1 Tax=Clostridium beijerinckii TaxID=1520 RepID=A0A9Q5CM34_CLOBE|nr:helix-turn-helix domain-containing protein [Clostridium beijerinckii]AQS03498.1 hypothetical protein CLBIJ_09130 [Clostridium beijerinckii]MBA2884754.1 hypothetical protein [Clostridium beijerinckii]MBA2899476.1 hypothetical protein [Clostridium beijerinckii]MBA2909105.1 hypothetical protein [Clostridium beijerinckii]MBA9016960.1 hypothetical protein [Clostridium beijerinckii]
MERDFKGIWIPKEIWLNTHLTMNEKLFLVEIDSLDNEKGCFASNDYFAEFFGLSKNRCSEIIKSLEKKGFLSISYKYKAGTKAIENRIIKLLEISIRGTRNIDCGVRNIDRGTRDIDRGYSENCEDNNTILNNTINNINTISKDIVSSTKVQPIIDKWNELGLQKLISINKGTNRYKLLQARIKEYGQDRMLQAIENIKCSSFLKGQNNKNWTVTFDWLVKPNNFIKILEGNYVDKENPVKITKNKEVQPLRFNNFEPRNYDYDNLEKKLLGWDNDD